MKIISGGQTGADQAGWRAAKRFGLETGGWMPKGFMTEDGDRPEFAEMYGAKEHAVRGYGPRTAANIRHSDATLIFATDPESPGTKKTYTEAYKQEKPSVVVKVYGEPGARKRVIALINIWLAKVQPKTLNIAGNRESKSPGIGEWVEKHLCEMFRLMGFEEVPQ